MSVSWRCKTFSELTLEQVYSILALRAEVFVVEQQCAYQDVDGKDPLSYHVWLEEEGKVVAYCRLLPAGVSYSIPAIGRVVTSSTVRGKGYGKRMMEEAVKQCELIFPGQDICLSAQYHLKLFYNQFGFAEEGSVYLEDAIPHVHMHRKA
jgi:ElaA protein